ncbi:MAG: zinc-binding dehydrogenase [Myxococcales bacterium]|nr:zinc-binding dehydrogenase [Myxococcales bacterium]
MSRWAVGDRVLAITGGGAMAEHVVIAQDELVAVPVGMSAAEAASIPEAFVTAWDAIIVQGRMARGDAVLIHAAASGVGMAAVAIVQAFGGHAIATTRSAAKAEVVRRYAPTATVIVAQDKASFAAEVMAAAPGGVAVVLDCVGAAYFDDNVSVLAPGGRWLLIGFLGGSRKEISLVPLLMKKLSLIGSTLRSRGSAERAATAAAFAREVMPLFASGAIALPPLVVRPIDELAAAQAEMERNLTVGKTVLTMWQQS